MIIYLQKHKLHITLQSEQLHESNTCNNSECNYSTCYCNYSGKTEFQSLEENKRRAKIERTFSRWAFPFCDTEEIKTVDHYSEGQSSPKTLHFSEKKTLCYIFKKVTFQWEKKNQTLNFQKSYISEKKKQTRVTLIFKKVTFQWEKT